MINHVWSVLCQQTIVDARTGATTHVNTVNGASFFEDEENLILPPLVISTRWAKEDTTNAETTEIRVRIDPPEGRDKIKIGQGTITLGTDQHGINSNIEVAHLRLKSGGRYSFLVDHRDPVKKTRWKTVAKLPIDVKLVPSPEKEANEND
ncbi:MAG: hypothetical protein ABFS09_03715 [Thermodesulfobacteriota bacterium]